MLNLEERRERLQRFLWWLFLGFLLLFAIGMLGFRYLVGTDWVDAFYNSSLHFAGGAPHTPVTTPYQKVFVSIYGMIAGFLFVGLAVFVIDQIVDLHFFEPTS